MAVSQFKSFLAENDLDFEIIISDGASTHTAQQAADVHGVPVSNIVKSLLTNCEIDCASRYILFLVPGDKRLDFEFWQKELGAEKMRMANADEVKSITGYSIGGVPPFGHTAKLETYIADGFDADSLLVAAAGSHDAVFKIDLSKLRSIVG